MQSVGLRIWQTGQSNKILKNKECEKVAIDSLSVKLFKNETEGVRFFVTPIRDISSLNLSFKLNETAIEISAEYALYVNVEKSSAGTRSETGYYPDALLPFEVAKKYKVNNVIAGHNQEIYVNIKAGKDAVAGEYLAQIIVFADDERLVIPLKITVWDYTLPNKNHTRQYFIIDEKHLSLVEDNEGFNVYKKYYEQLLKYRVNGSRMPFSLNEDYKTVTKSYIDNLRIYYADERITVFNIPVFFTEKYDDIDYVKTEYLFNEIIKASAEDGVDYFKKSLTYLWILDEPHLSPTRTEYCKKVLPKFELLKNKFSLLCAEKGKENEVYKKLQKSIENLPNIITAGINGKIIAQDPKDYYITWCPPFDNLSQHEFSKMTSVLNKGEKWWYGCNWPAPPYPTYHIDDSYISPRVLSWIQFAYEIKGNLYWRINYWANKVDGKLSYIDPYQKITYPTTNGEGMLVYPGRKFGVDGFVPSVRLNAIRDGIEDYEMLYCLDGLLESNAKKINKKSITTNQLLQPLYSRLFNKTIITNNAVTFFDKARDNVANILLAANKYSFTVLDFDIKNGSITFYVEGVKVFSSTANIIKQGNAYKAEVEGDIFQLVLDDSGSQFTIEIFTSEIIHEKKYALSDCWAKTVSIYDVKNSCPENILRPYYDVLDNLDVTNYNMCCKALTELISFVWRTETAIVKEKISDGYIVTLTVPKGTFNTLEKYRVDVIDENARRYVIVTNKSNIIIEVENEKGRYSANLYL